MHNFNACPILYGMKLFDCLPNYIADELVNVGDLRELRIRNGGAIKVNVSGRWYYVAKGALSLTANKAITPGCVCDDIVKKACNNSVYAYEKTLADGFFTLDDGVRVGVCGEVFGANRSVFRSYTSLCFRIPHYVNCVSLDVLKKCEGGNVLVLGAPGSGKTTFLRDIAVKLGQSYNVLVADERGELFYDEALTERSGCDVIKWAQKSYAFSVGVRAMSPNYIICDELCEEDVPFVKSCLSCGVKLICSAHAKNMQDFINRFNLPNSFETVINLNESGSSFSGF